MLNLINNATKSKDNYSVLNRYFRELKTQNKAKITISIYKTILRKFINEIKKDIKDIKKEDVRNWMDKNYDAKKEPSTYNNRLSVLNGFFKYCLQIEMNIKSVPISNKWRPKIPKSIPKYLDDERRAKLRFYAEKLSLRDKCIFYLIEKTGLRRSEVSKLNIEKIDFKNKVGKVIAKRNKEREFNISDEAIYYLKELLKNAPKTQKPLFLNRSGKRLSARSIYNVIAKLGKMSGIEVTIGPHVLRHTLATSILNKGSGLKYVQTVLDHKNPSTTEIYARTMSKHIVNIYNNCME